jgi:hypothetical protein
LSDPPHASRSHTGVTSERNMTVCDGLGFSAAIVGTDSGDKTIEYHPRMLSNLLLDARCWDFHPDFLAVMLPKPTLAECKEQGVHKVPWFLV